MKDKVENIPQEFRGSLRPHSAYVSSTSSTSSYASSLSSASSASSSSGSTSGSLKSSSSSFLHSKASQVAGVNDQPNQQYAQYTTQQYHTLRRYPSCAPSPSTPQVSTPSPSSPSSSPASSTFDGYATIPAKCSTLTVNPQNVRQDHRIPCPNPPTQTTPVANNFRTRVMSTSNSVHNFGDPVPNGQRTNFNNALEIHDVGSRSNLNSNGPTNVGVGMRGVSSLGEVTSSTHRSPHYASTPHLFVFQTVDDDSDDGANDRNDITKANTISNRSTGRSEHRNSLVHQSSRTLPPQQSPLQQHQQQEHQQQPLQEKEPIYSSTTEYKKDVARREDEASRHISGHYEAPHAVTTGRRSSSCSMLSQDPLQVTNQDVVRIETFFKGHRTQVWVCRTMANLYSEVGSGTDAKWKLQYMGVPLLLLDVGDTKSRDKRRLQLIFAEKETGFPLWQDVIDNLTSYKVQEPHFHTLYLSSDHRRKIGLSFNEGSAAMSFNSQLESLTSNPENISLSAPGKKKSKTKEKVPKYKPPRKTNISKPCNFHHVTTVDPTDKTRYYSMQVFSRNPATGVTPEPRALVDRPIPPPAAATAV